MTAEYAEPDWEVVDYDTYCLDPAVIDRQTGAPLLLRGPRPPSMAKNAYFACIGAAQTFGRFCERPFPSLLRERLDLPVLNLGRGGAGPAFFSEDNEPLLEYINRARFVVIQIMAGRSESNSEFESKGLGYYTRRSDGAAMGCDEAFRDLLANNTEDYVGKIVAETRQNWVAHYRCLLHQITVPKVLLWFSERRPDYREQYKDVHHLFGSFPQLVNQEMVNQLKKCCDEYVECVSRKGLPQTLTNRFTGKRTALEDPWTGTWQENWYYPSPEMHRAAADALERTCKRLIKTATPAPVAVTGSTASPAAIEALLDDPPKLHYWYDQWQTGGMSREACQAILDICRGLGPGFQALETGAGLSSLLLLASGAGRHVCIAPDTALRDRLAQEIAARGLDPAKHEFLVGRSEQVLPQLAAALRPTIDLGLIDGGHGWPTVFVDFCYINMLLKEGGYLLVDDLQLYSCQQLYLLLKNQPHWSLQQIIHYKMAIFRKETAEPFLPDFSGQPFIRTNSVDCP